MTLKSGLEVTRGHSKLYHSKVSYSPSTVTKGAMLYRLRDRLIGQKLRNFYTQPVFSTPKRVIPLEFREDV